MSLTVLEVPFVRPGLRVWAKQKERGTYEDEAAALDAVRRLAETVDPDLLVLAWPGSFPGLWLPVAEGQHLVTWASFAWPSARRRGIPRVKRKDDRLLCGWGSCGGALATADGEGRIRPVEALVYGAERNGLPTWVVRGQARRFRTHPRIDDPLRARQRRAMGVGPHVDSRARNFISAGIDEDVILLECPSCVPKLGGPAVSLLITRLDSGVDRH